MRIALVSDVYLPRVGGIELHVHDLATQLRLAGHHVTVFTATDAVTIDDEAVVRLPALVPLPVATDLLRERMRPDRYDVLHAHLSLFSPLAWSALRIAVDNAVPAVATMHSLSAAGGVLMPWLLARLDRAFGPRVLWTAVSEVVAESLRQVVRDRPVEVLHNGIDPAPWRQPDRLEHVPTVVSTMRFVHRKRPGALLRILRGIREQLPPEVPLRAVLIGAGPQAASIAWLARRRGMTWLELPGRLTRHEIQRLYAAADVYLAPAQLESFGVAALEARCAGLAVVAMASGGVGEFVRPGQEGFLVDDDEKMAATAAELLTDRSLLRGIQDHNRWTDPAMTWHSVVERHLRVYRTQLALSDDYLPSGVTTTRPIVELHR